MEDDKYDPLSIDYDGPEVMGVIIIASAFGMTWLLIGLLIGWAVWA